MITLGGVMLLLISMFVLISLLFVLVIRIRQTRSEGSFPYQKRKSFLELSAKPFYNILKQVVSDQYVIFGRVHAGEVLTVDKELFKSKRKSFLKRSMLNRSILYFVARLISALSQEFNWRGIKTP